MNNIGFVIERSERFGRMNEQLNYEIFVGKRKKGSIFISGPEVRKLIQEQNLIEGKSIGRMNVEVHGDHAYFSELIDTSKKQVKNLFKVINRTKIAQIMMFKILKDSKRTFKKIKIVKFLVPSRTQQAHLQKIGIKKLNANKSIPVNSLKPGIVGKISRIILNKRSGRRK